MKLYFLLAIGVFGLSKERASAFLSRSRRANGGFEEMKEGNLERECIQETCNNEEFNEVYDDLTKSGKSTKFTALFIAI